MPLSAVDRHDLHPDRTHGADTALAGQFNYTRRPGGRRHAIANLEQRFIVRAQSLFRAGILVPSDLEDFRNQLQQLRLARAVRPDKAQRRQTGFLMRACNRQLGPVEQAPAA
jgi:hypothetical protein